MTDEYYVASAAESGWTSDSSNEYNKRMARSRRVLSKFNDEQKRTAWQNIKSTSIVLMGINLVDRTITRTFDRLQSVINKFTYAPLMEGLSEYTDQLTEFQAIVQNSAQWFDNIGGADHIQAITDALDDLNSYADLTIYKFRDMQRSFTGFVNAGLTVEDSATMAKGIASWTAFMGKGAYDYASAAYMMNQALLAGKMQYYQWRSIEQFSQIGGMLPKKLFIETAKSLGKDAPNWDELSNPYDEEATDQNFRDSLADDWLTSSVMLKAMDILANFGTKYDEAKLKAQGFSDEIINMAKTAFGESQKVRTFSQFMDAAVESVGTGWAQIFRSFFGDTTVATKMWTKLMLQVTGDIDSVVESVKKQAENFAKAGGRDAIEGILFNIWDVIKNIAKSVSKLFHIVIPNTNNLGASLAELAKKIEWFTGLLAGKNKIDSGNGFFSKLFLIFQRLFGISKKIWNQALKPIFEALWSLLSKFGPKIWNFVDTLVGKLENFVDLIINSGIFDAIATLLNGSAFSKTSEEGSGIFGFIKNFLTSIGDALGEINLKGIITSIQEVIKAVAKIFSGEGLSNFLSIIWTVIKMKVRLKLFQSVLKEIAKIADYFSDIANPFWSIIGSVLGIVIAIEILSNIDVGKMWKSLGKILILSIVLGLLSNAFRSMADCAYAMQELVPIIGLIALVFIGIVGLIYILKTGGIDLDIILGILGSIGTVLKYMAWIIAAIIPLMVVLSTRATIAEINARQANSDMSKMAEALKTLFKKKDFSLVLRLGDETAKRMLATAAIIAAVFKYVQGAGELIMQMASLSEDPVKYTLGIVGLLVVMGALLVFLELIKKMTLSQGTSFLTKGDSRRLIWMGVFVYILGRTIKTIASAIKIVGELDSNAILQGFSAIGAILLGLYILLVKLEKAFSSSKGINLKGLSVNIFSQATAIIGFALMLGAVSILIKRIISVAEYIGQAEDAYLNLWKAFGLFAAIGGVLVGIYALISLISGKIVNKNNIFKTALSIGALSILIFSIAILMGELALIASYSTGDIISAAIAMAIVAATVIAIYFAISKIAKSASGGFGRMMLTLLSVIVIIGILSYLTSALAGLMTSGDGGKLIGMVGSLVLLVLAIAAIAVVLGVLQTATMGIGAVAIWAGIAALAAIAGVVWILSDASAKFMSATEDLADGINDLVDAFRAIGDINFKTFKSNLSKFLDAIESALPRIQKLAAAVGGIAGTLIIAGGDITIGAGSVSIPSGAVAGANVGINTASVNVGASGSQSQTSAINKTIQNAIPKEETIKEKVGGAVSGFFGGLFQSIGEALPNIALGWVNGLNAIKQMMGSGSNLDEIDTTGWDEEDIKALEQEKKNLNDPNPVISKHAANTIKKFKDKYPDSFKKKIEAPNAGIQSALDSIDNAAYFDSKYGWLDDKALGDISKKQLVNDIEGMIPEIKDAVRESGVIDKDRVNAATLAQAKQSPYYKVYLQGNMFGDIANRALGELAQ